MRQLNGSAFRNKIQQIAAKEQKTLQGVRDDIGEKIGMSGAAIKGWTQGTQPHDESLIDDLARALGCKPEEICDKKGKVKGMKKVNNVEIISLWREIVDILEDIRMYRHDKTSFFKLIRAVNMARIEISEEIFQKLYALSVEYLFPLIYIKDCNLDNLSIEITYNEDDAPLEITYDADLYDEVITMIGEKYAYPLKKDNDVLDYPSLFADDLVNAIYKVTKDSSYRIEVILVETAYQYVEEIFSQE